MHQNKNKMEESSRAPFSLDLMSNHEVMFIASTVQLFVGIIHNNQPVIESTMKELGAITHKIHPDAQSALTKRLGELVISTLTPSERSALDHANQQAKRKIIMPGEY